MTRLKDILRWLAVLPGAILAAITVMFPVHWAAMFIRHFGGFSEPIITNEEGKGLLQSMPLESLEGFGDALFVHWYVNRHWRSHRAAVPIRYSYSNRLVANWLHVVGYSTSHVDEYAQRRLAVQDGHNGRAVAN
jgi:hypothetical protein